MQVQEQQDTVAALYLLSQAARDVAYELLKHADNLEQQAQNRKDNIKEAAKQVCPRRTTVMQSLRGRKTSLEIPFGFTLLNSSVRECIG